MILKGHVPIHPTEDPDKVRSSIFNIFPVSELTEDENSLSFTSSDPSRFIEILKDLEIRDTAVMVLDRGRDEDLTSFFLNKQAAFMGRVNFTEGGSTLGDIEVIVTGGALELISLVRP